MKQLKAFIIICCLLSIVNCKTTPPSQYQENKQEQVSLIIDGSKSSTVNIEIDDINEEKSAYINMDENTFINELNAKVDNLSRIEGIWTNEKNTFKIGIQKAQGKDKYIAFILNSQEPTMRKGEIIAEFNKTRYEHIYSTEYYLEDKTRIHTKSYINEHGKLLIFLIEWEKESVILFREFPMKEATEEREKVSDLEQPSVKDGETGNDENYVQVGAWENHKYAQKLLVKINEYYPDAYIVEHNNFDKIRIPDVFTEEQGALVTKDIEEKFNLKPVLVLKKQ